MEKDQEVKCMSYTPKRGKPLSYWLVLSLFVLLQTQCWLKKKVSYFTVAELEALGVSTVEESIEMMQSIAHLSQSNLGLNELH